MPAIPLVNSFKVPFGGKAENIPELADDLRQITEIFQKILFLPDIFRKVWKNFCSLLPAWLLYHGVGQLPGKPVCLAVKPGRSFAPVKTYYSCEDAWPLNQFIVLKPVGLLPHYCLLPPGVHGAYLPSFPALLQAFSDCHAHTSAPAFSFLYSWM